MYKLNLNLLHYFTTKHNLLHFSDPISTLTHTKCLYPNLPQKQSIWFVADITYFVTILVFGKALHLTRSVITKQIQLHDNITIHVTRSFQKMSFIYSQLQNLHTQDWNIKNNIQHNLIITTFNENEIKMNILHILDYVSKVH